MSPDFLNAKLIVYCLIFLVLNCTYSSLGHSFVIVLIKKKKLHKVSSLFYVASLFLFLPYGKISVAGGHWWTDMVGSLEANGQRGHRRLLPLPQLPSDVCPFPAVRINWFHKLLFSLFAIQNTKTTNSRFVQNGFEK